MDQTTYPGDDIIPDAEMVYNQTRTIAAPASDIFPWIIQLGKGRGGWYLTSRWEGMLPKSWAASRIIDPAFQQLKPGDRVPDYGTKDDYFDVVSIDPPRSLVYESLRFGTKFTWAILLHETESSDEAGHAQTMIHLRFRGKIASTGLKRSVIVRLGGILDHITTAPMLSGLAERVEKEHSQHVIRGRCRRAASVYTCPPLPSEKEIRLLELLPGNTNDNIRCKIHHREIIAPTTSPSKRKSLKAIQATLDSDWGVKETIEGRYLFYSQALGTLQWDHPDPDFDQSLYEVKPLDEFQPRFEALSYTWGTEPPCGFIIVEGTTVTKFPVRENLLSALQQLRYKDESRTLWIDAVCINQNDNNERRIQVGRMASIYRLCYRVVIWLGPEEDNSNIALKALNKIGLQIELFTDWSRTLSPYGTEKSWFLPETVIPYDEETRSAIGRLLERPWFRRLWVVQEFKLGNSRSIMQCGQEVIPTSIFRRAVVCLSQKLDRAKEISWETLLDTNQLVYSSDKLCFRVMMSQVKEKLCSDPRDKIYGVLSLAPKGLAADVPADYTKDPGQLFLDLFLAHAKNVKRLEMFHQCSQLSRNLDIPSWVPDWTAPSMVRQLIEDQFSAAFSQAEFSFTPPNMLHVTGVHCAFISETLSYMPDEATDAEKIRIARSWQPEYIETGTYITGESMRMAHAKTICMNTLEERFPGFQLQPDEAFWEDQDFDHPLFGDDLEDVPDSYEIPLEYRDIQNALNRCSNRRYFKTDEGYIGIAPADTQPDDAIVVLLGCSRPLVLRPTPDDQWILIGECFVLGLNDAIALLGPLPEPWRVREIFSEGERYAPHFYNPDEDIVTHEDPRLDPLDEWERIEHEVDVDDPEIYNYIRHKVTGEVTPFDPRLSADGLRARGVPLREFNLI